MAWAIAGASSACNRCRRVLAAGARVFSGEHTPAKWCLDCAAELGLDGGPALGEIAPVERLDVSALATAAPEFVAAMRRLKETAHAAARPTRRDVTLRIVGSE
ncbi:MAG: hypothetical protein IT348_05840 [Candidatus Eisenbacteria bacterium]|nr:hypothetical protein [Candidatus Eisenbacteria bacterium]